MAKTKLELTWIGKDTRPKLEPRILLEDASKSYHAPKRVTDKDIFDNRLIFGDNLLALRALESEFTGKIKCVFIDPPYNTGSAFAHYDDEIDLESGFLMLPQAIPQSVPVTGLEPITGAPGSGETAPTGGATTPGTGVPAGVTISGQAVPTAKPGTDKVVELMFTADRNGLFTAWNAVANLADLAGKVQVTVRAESEMGFDKAKLQNGVMEPLREADLIE